MVFQLRDYQQDALDSCFNYLNNNSGNPILCLPTGSGKSIVVSKIFENLLQFPGTRGLCITHSKELIVQNHSKMPTGIGAGIYSAGVGKRNVHNRVIFCGIQSVYKKANLFTPVNLIVIDECQYISPKAETMYGRFISELKALNPNLRVIGLTATPYRTGDGVLTDCTLFDEIVYDLPMARLIDEGYLSRLIGKRGAVEADISKMGNVAGEYNLGMMAKEFDQSHITQAAVREIVNLGHDRNKWLGFCSSVEHCYHTQAFLNAQGIKCGVIHGALDKGDRDFVLLQHRLGDIQCILNYGVLTTGYDFPEIDLIFLLRSTQSTGLYVQMLGRGMRPVYAAGFDLGTIDGRMSSMAAGQKPNGCLVLDYGQNIVTHGPVDKITIEKKLNRETGELEDRISVQPTKMCPECNLDNHAQARECPECGYVYPIEVKHETEASEAAILSADIEPEWFNVDSVSYDRHKKAGSPDSLRVSYVCGMDVKREWVSLENPRAVKFAHAWWALRGTGFPPVSVSEALQRLGDIRCPVRISTKPEGKYERIVDYEDGYHEIVQETVKRAELEEDEIPW